MGLVAQTIENIANSLPGSIYLRLSDAQKAEFEVSRTDLKGKTAIIYANNPDIALNQNPVTIQEGYPIQIWFLQLQPNPDEVSIDTLLDDTKEIALEFYREFRKESVTPWNNWEETTNINLNNTSAYQIGNEYLSGWELALTLSIENYLCPPVLSSNFKIDEQGWAKVFGNTVNYQTGEGWQFLHDGAAAQESISLVNPGLSPGTYRINITVETIGGDPEPFRFNEFGEAGVLIEVTDTGTYTGVVTLLGGLDLFLTKEGGTFFDFTRNYLVTYLTITLDQDPF